MSAESEAVWGAFYNRIEKAQAADGALEGLRDVAGKAAENAARVAAVLTVVERPEAPDIQAPEISAGCEIAGWYVAKALRLAGAHRQSPILRNAIKLLEWLRAKGKTEITRSEIMQFGPPAVRTKSEAEAAITSLEEHGWLVPFPIDGKGLRWSVVKEPNQ